MVQGGNRLCLGEKMTPRKAFDKKIEKIDSCSFRSNLTAVWGHCRSFKRVLRRWILVLKPTVEISESKSRQGRAYVFPETKNSLSNPHPPGES